MTGNGFREPDNIIRRLYNSFLIGFKKNIFCHPTGRIINALLMGAVYTFGR